MKKIEDLNYYELLEVPPTASAQEIHRAYERVRKIYEPNSIALYSLFTPEETAAIHQRIEEAYRTLVYEDNRRRYDATLKGEPEELPTPEPTRPRPSRPSYQSAPAQPVLSLPAQNHYLASEAKQSLPSPKPDREEPAAAPVSEYIGEFTGPALKALREQRGQDLRACADLTKVGLRYLEAIEAENYQKLPARPYLRGFLMLYAKALGCDPGRVASDYLRRYEAIMKPGQVKK